MCSCVYVCMCKPLIIFERLNRSTLDLIRSMSGKIKFRENLNRNNPTFWDCVFREIIKKSSNAACLRKLINFFLIFIIHSRVIVKFYQSFSSAKLTSNNANSIKNGWLFQDLLVFEKSNCSILLRHSLTNRFCRQDDILELKKIALNAV